MASWNDTVLSTSSSIERIEKGVSTLLSSSLTFTNNKIALAKDLLKARIQSELKAGNYDYLVDYENGKQLIDLIANPEIFALASDYYTCALIYADVATSNSSGAYVAKSANFMQEYDVQFLLAYATIHISRTQDGETTDYNPTTIRQTGFGR